MGIYQVVMDTNVSAVTALPMSSHAKPVQFPTRDAVTLLIGMHFKTLSLASVWKATKTLKSVKCIVQIQTMLSRNPRLSVKNKEKPPTRAPLPTSRAPQSHVHHHQRHNAVIWSMLSGINLSMFRMSITNANKSRTKMESKTFVDSSVLVLLHHKPASL